MTPLTATLAPRDSVLLTIRFHPPILRHFRALMVTPSDAVCQHLPSFELRGDCEPTR